MSNHFHALGFPVDEADDLDSLIHLASAEGDRFPSEHGEYCLWSPGEGVQIWLHFVDTDLVSISPHYAGTSKRTVGLIERVRQEEDNLLEGGFYGWADPGRNLDDGDYPFLFYVPDFHRYDDLVLPRRASIQLTAFAHVLTCYPTEADFKASQVQSEIQYAANYFLPNGLFGEGPPEPEACFAGRLLSATLQTNPYSRHTFYALKIATLGGDVDVVAAPETVDGQLLVGAIVHGEYWLSGRVLPERPMDPTA